MLEQMQAIFNDKNFIRKTIAITLPIALQNLLNNVLNLIDTLMIGKLGEAEIAGVGLSNKVFFVFTLLIFGVCSGSAILASQYWGKREVSNIKRVFRLELILSVIGSLIFMIPAILFPNQVMRIFTPDPNMIAVGANYLRIVAISYPIAAITFSYVVTLRSMNVVKPSVIITSVAIGVNVFLNYALIFGNFGFPELGVAGGALATLIARIVEMVTLLIMVYTAKVGDDGMGDFAKTKMEKGHSLFDKAFLSKFFSTASPVIGNEFAWGLGVTMYSLVYGRMGENATAAITITQTVEQLVLVFFMGMSSAAAIILGNELGSGQLDTAERYAKNYLVLDIVLGISVAILTILLRKPIISVFKVSALVASYINLCLLVFSFFIPIKVINTLIIVSILRSGGDTKFGLGLDIASVWCIGIPMAIIGGLVFKLPIYYVYAMIFVEEAFKLVMASRRYKKKIWLRNIVE